MNQLLYSDIVQYIEENIGDFHTRRINCLNKLKLKSVLRKKNPYLFRAKHLLTSEQIIRKLTDANQIVFKLSMGSFTVFDNHLVL